MNAGITKEGRMSTHQEESPELRTQSFPVRVDSQQGSPLSVTDKGPPVNIRPIRTAGDLRLLEEDVIPAERYGNAGGEGPGPCIGSLVWELQYAIEAWEDDRPWHDPDEGADWEEVGVGNHIEEMRSQLAEGRRELALAAEWLDYFEQQIEALPSRGGWPKRDMQGIQAAAVREEARAERRREAEAEAEQKLREKAETHGPKRYSRLRDDRPTHPTMRNLIAFKWHCALILSEVLPHKEGDEQRLHPRLSPILRGAPSVPTTPIEVVLHICAAGLGYLPGMPLRQMMLEVERFGDEIDQILRDIAEGGRTDPRHTLRGAALVAYLNSLEAPT